jgi:hypothetical protein
MTLCGTSCGTRCSTNNKKMRLKMHSSAILGRNEPTVELCGQDDKDMIVMYHKFITN